MENEKMVIWISMITPNEFWKEHKQKQLVIIFFIFFLFISSICNVFLISL